MAGHGGGRSIGSMSTYSYPLPSTLEVDISRMINPSGFIVGVSPEFVIDISPELAKRYRESIINFKDSMDESNSKYNIPEPIVKAIL